MIEEKEPKNYINIISEYATKEIDHYKLIAKWTIPWCIWVTLCSPVHLVVAFFGSFFVFSPVIWFFTMVGGTVAGVVIIIVKGYIFILGGVITPGILLTLFGTVFVTFVVFLPSAAVAGVFCFFHNFPCCCILPHYCCECCIFDHFSKYKKKTYFVTRRELDEYYERLKRENLASGTIEVICYHWAGTSKHRYRSTTFSKTFYINVTKYDNSITHPFLEENVHNNDKEGLMHIMVRKKVEISDEIREKLEAIRSELVEKNKHRDRCITVTIYLPTFEGLDGIHHLTPKSREINDDHMDKKPLQATTTWRSLAARRKRKYMESFIFYNRPTDLDDVDSKPGFNTPNGDTPESILGWLYPKLFCNCTDLSKLKYNCLMIYCCVFNFMEKDLESKFAVLETLGVEKKILEFEVGETPTVFHDNKKTEEGYSFLPNNNKKKEEDDEGAELADFVNHNVNHNPGEEEIPIQYDTFNVVGMNNMQPMGMMQPVVQPMQQQQHQQQPVVVEKKGESAPNAPVYTVPDDPAGGINMF